jgi:hypothetical protein
MVTHQCTWPLFKYRHHGTDNTKYSVDKHGKRHYVGYKDYPMEEKKKLGENAKRRVIKAKVCSRAHVFLE